MANAQRGEKSLTVGGKTYILKLTTGAMCALEEACSTKDAPMTFGQILARVGEGSITYLRFYIWASLLDHHPGITVTQVEQLIDEAGGVDHLGDAIQELAASVEPDPEDVRPPKAQTTTGVRGTGAPSTSRRVKSA